VTAVASLTRVLELWSTTQWPPHTQQRSTELNI